MSISRMVYTGTSYFGKFARNEIKTEIVKHHFKKAFLISDKDLIKCGIVAKVEEVLKENQTSYEIDAEVKPNPTIENVIYGLELYKKSGSDFIIAVGGGSVIDTAKAIAVIANNPENADVVSLEGMDKSSHPAVPIIALPTTAGTGSETTMDYVITNTKEKRKMACMDSKVVPAAAILDTEIMASLPLKLTAATAMDALTHAVESYLSLGAFSFSETLSLKSVSLISENFLKVLENPGDYEVRKELAIAQYMAGMSFTNVGLGIVHSMAHPLSAFYDVPHGVANALILPYVLEFNAEVCGDKIKELAKAFDSGFDMTKDAKEALKCCVDTIRKFNTQAGLPQTLVEINVKTEDIDALAQSAYADASTPDNPREVSAEMLKQLYKKMYE
ncbi:iron-containing alcohol dehydrogenase family protein [Frisingicoccus sp.]|uniref:iron-containing alcohol dehydrogenase family protein n=1 Tax=Frisingicoccus sp. TaxID=1918627 RepID=UPI002E7710DC|nr:iron-containing alcohol dehydrogenase family protein [Frisingicoccus sp.]MEE0751150.1 iron-containing alcohol dehydrogenase family protein [Frisingicoccus sp.]